MEKVMMIGVQLGEFDRPDIEKVKNGMSYMGYSRRVSLRQY